ncbi:MAG: sulfite exporter TauE/SafE family protein [Calditrichota bacterium]
MDSIINGSAMIHFPISGVETWWWLPLVTAFLLSSLTSTAGVTGAFLLLPFQVSVLGFVGPATVSTNLLFNVIAIPGGVAQFIRQKRVVWPLALTAGFGIMPGFVIGAILGINYFQDPRLFKLFVGLVLLYVGVRLAISTFRIKTAPNLGGRTFSPPLGRVKTRPPREHIVEPLVITDSSVNLRRLAYRLDGKRYQISTPGLLALCSGIGLVSGAYGVGGGALLSPFLVASFRQPVKAVSGAALISTFLVSTMGVLVYYALSWFYAGTKIPVQPDWLLGGLFGLGGIAGITVGSILQRWFPVKVIQIILLICITIIVWNYVGGYFK